MNHMEFAAAESQALQPTEWDGWLVIVEQILGHDLDGSEEENGYSLDGAYEAWQRKVSPNAYAKQVKATPHYQMRLYANGTGFPGATLKLAEPADIGSLVDSLGEPAVGRRRTVASVAARTMEEMVELCLAAGLNSGEIFAAVADALANQAIKQGHQQKRTVFPSEILADTSTKELAGEVADIRLLLKDLVWVANAQQEAHSAELALMPKLKAARAAGELYLDRSGTMRRRKPHVLSGATTTKR